MRFLRRERVSPDMMKQIAAAVHVTHPPPLPRIRANPAGDAPGKF